MKATLDFFGLIVVSFGLVFSTANKAQAQAQAQTLVESAATTRSNGKVIFTDVLDDDRRALQFLFSTPSEAAKIRFIVTSTGNAYLKAAVVRAMLRSYGLNIPVIEGTATDLSSSDTTAFAGDYQEREGVHLLTEPEIRRAKSYLGVSGSGAQFTLDYLKKNMSEGERLDVLLLTAPLDLTPGIVADSFLARSRLGRLFTMGLDKLTGNGSVVSPYNCLAGVRATRLLLQYYEHEGIFTQMYHVRSDVVTGRSGLPNGYLPEEVGSENLRAQLNEVMQAHPGFQNILRAANEYALNWRHSAVRQFGTGFGDSDRWVPSTFRDPEAAARFYFADLIPTLLSTYTDEQLAALKFERRISRIAPGDDGANAPFELEVIDVKSPSAGRPRQDLIEIDGISAARLYIERLRLNPPRIANAVESAPSEAANPFASTTSLYARATNHERALLLVFKNSPDDWFALSQLVATQQGRMALRRGGVICEGFETDGVAIAVKAFLKHFMMGEVRVAPGYKYESGQVDAIANFTGERVLYQEKQGVRAFNELIRATGASERDLSAVDEIKRHLADAPPEIKVDLMVLGEGHDVWVDEVGKKIYGERPGDAYLMGGGRFASDGAQKGQLVLTRNWVRAPLGIVEGVEKFAAAGGRVHIFSSHAFGGSLASDAKANGNSGVAYKTLQNLGATDVAFAAIFNHWVNWTRLFNWKLSKVATPFDPEAAVPVLTTSPLGLHIADEWLQGDLEIGRSTIKADEISLRHKIENKPHDLVSPTKVFWLHRDHSKEIEAMARRFSLSIDRLVKSHPAEVLSAAVREHGLFTPTGDGAYRAFMANACGRANISAEH